jgi:RTX calcium-binding nonapeptide repeat (4 copies)
VRRTLSLAAIALTLVLPGAARAGTVHIEFNYPATLAVFDAAPGELNRVSVTLDPAQGELVFYDQGARLVAGEYCGQVDANTVSCFADVAALHLGDRNDLVSLGNTKGYNYCSLRGCSYFPTNVFGGDGDDTLLGSTFGDGLLGEAGNDTLVGNQGQDTLSGGAGNDRILALDGARDSIDCGPGIDRLVADRAVTDFRYGCEALLGG